MTNNENRKKLNDIQYSCLLYTSRCVQETVQGLSPEASYEICEINTADLKEQAKKTITGGFLIDQGMEVWLDKEYDSKIFHLKKTK